jgi:hypothetical protein
MKYDVSVPTEFDCLKRATPVVSAVFDLLQFDAEIVFWEGKTREQQHQMEFLSQEAARVESAVRLSEEQVCQYGCHSNLH